MTEDCKGNENTVECAQHFTQTCTPESGKDNAHCSEFNQKFCGPPGSSFTDPAFPGLSSSSANVQYCTLTHARSYCSSSDTPNSPACQWIQGIQANEQCHDHPLQGNCLPAFKAPQAMAYICKSHPSDPVCHNSQKGSPPFIVSFNPQPNSPQVSLNRNLAASSEPNNEGHSSFMNLSPIRELCHNGELYDCQ